MAAYPNKGKLDRSSKRTSEKSPDWWGDLRVDPAYIQSLTPNEDGLLVIKLSGWDKTYPSTGNAFLSISVDTYVKKEEKLPYE